MAPCKLECCIFIACALSIANPQPLPESVFRQLTAEELREIELVQNPALLDLAARTGERVVIYITGASQGAIIQARVNTVLNCSPWLQNFPGGTIRWYRYLYRDLDHTILEVKTPQTREALNVATSLRRIEGVFDEIFNITSVRVSLGPEDPHRGIYECEVCVARDTLFEDCHSANTTVATAGRPPILNDTTGRNPDSSVDNVDVYRIGSTVCVHIDPLNPEENSPLLRVELRCPSVGERLDLNISAPIPQPTRTWIHTSIDSSVSAVMSSDLAGSEPTLTEEFIMQFPLLDSVSSMGLFTFSTADEQDSLLFVTENVIKNETDRRYQVLREAFGFWTCQLNNSLGTAEATTFISDMCGMFRPTILSPNCSAVGRLIPNERLLAEVERGQSTSIPVGCDVCIREAQELWLTVACPTNVDMFPNTSVTITWKDERGNVLQGTGAVLLVQQPGTYTCIADFGSNGVDEEETTVAYIPAIQLKFARNGFSSSGCNRLRTNQTFSPIDLCAFFGEQITLSCISMQENVTAAPVLQDDDSNSLRMNFTAGIGNNNQQFECLLLSTNPNIGERCIPISGGQLNLTVYEPATILIDRDETCLASAGEVYGTVRAPSPGGSAVLCCDAIGFPIPTVTWSRIVLNSDGVTVEIPVTNDSDIILEDENNRLKIMEYDPVTDDSTYVCRAENIAGIDSGVISIASIEETMQWEVSPWSECDPNCIGGTRTRSVWCATVPEGVVVADALCDCTIKPASSEQCTNVSGLSGCFRRPLWRAGEFSECSRGCAGGWRYRTVVCAMLHDGRVVDDTLCRDLYGPKPPAYDICYNRCCTVDNRPDLCQIHVSRNACRNPIFQQSCCWSCSLFERK